MKNILISIWFLLFLQPNLVSATSIRFNNEAVKGVLEFDTVFIDGKIDVLANDTLIIQDGTTIILGNDAAIALWKESVFQCNGSDQGITFQPLTENTFWRGIFTVEYYTKVTLTKCQAKNATTFYRGDNSSLLEMDSCNIQNCTVRAVFIAKSATAKIYNSQFNGSSKGIDGDGVCDLVSCVIKNFTEYGAITASGGIWNIINCLITDNNTANDGGGIFIGPKTTCNIYNCTIVKNSANYNSGGIHITGYANIINCIIWDNVSLRGENNLTATIGTVLQYSNVDEDLPDFKNIKDNFRIKPEFIDPISSDFRLSQSSKLINKGRPNTSGLMLPDYDLMGNARILNDTVDIGAYETTKEFVSKDEMFLTFDGLVYPIPALDQLIIETAIEGVVLEIIDQNGRVINTRKLNQITNINVSQIRSGCYILKFTYPSGKVSFVNALIK